MSETEFQLLSDFKRERNEALLSLDEAKIRAMILKWNGKETALDQHVFWGAVHKAITGCNDLPIILTTENGGEPSNTIVLEPEVLRALERWLPHARGVAKQRMD